MKVSPSQAELAFLPSKFDGSSEMSGLLWAVGDRSGRGGVIFYMIYLNLPPADRKYSDTLLYSFKKKKRKKRDL